MVSSVCRVCCESGATRTLFPLKNKKIIQTFERLSNLKFQAVGRPTVICTGCYAMLWSCSNLFEMDRKSQRIFKELAAKGLQTTPEAIDKLKKAMMQQLSVNPLKIDQLDGTTEDFQITEEVSIKIERLEKPLTESAILERNY